MNKFVPAFADVTTDVQRYLAMPKDVANGKYEHKWPQPGNKLQIELFSCEEELSRFYLDIFECRRTTSVVIGAELDRKASSQARVSNRPYLRFDFTDNPDSLLHRNPDGSLVEGNHVHLDLVGYGWGYAWPLEEQGVLVPDLGVYSLEGLFDALLALNSVTDRFRIEYSLGV